jgi:hypothetical protein
MPREVSQLRTRDIALIALLIAVIGLLVAVGLFAAIAAGALPELSPAWLGITIAASQLTALGLAIPSRGHRPGKIALLISSFVLVATAVAILLLQPVRASRGATAAHVPTVTQARHPAGANDPG